MTVKGCRCPGRMCRCQDHKWGADDSTAPGSLPAGWVPEGGSSPRGNRPPSAQLWIDGSAAKLGHSAREAEQEKRLDELARSLDEDPANGARGICDIILTSSREANLKLWPETATVPRCD